MYNIMIITFYSNYVNYIQLKNAEEIILFVCFPLHLFFELEEFRY